VRESRNGPVRPSQEVLRKAADFFRTRGYGSSTMRELGEALGIPPATLYYHIGSKQELLRAICVDAIESIIASGVHAWEGNPPGRLRRLDALIHAHMRAMLSEQAKHATLLIEMRSLDDDIAAEVVGLRDDYEAIIRAAIMEEQQLGGLRTDMPPEVLTLLLLNLLNWPVFWYHDTGPMTPDDLARQISELFFRGAKQPALR
jgi:TetR/AcrR family transcriptional regulator, cholesterol catabolism regulator